MGLGAVLSVLSVPPGVAQEQTDGSQDLYLGGTPANNIVHPGALSGTDPNTLSGSSERRTNEPGAAPQSGNKTIVITGEHGRKNVTVIENHDGESGLTINGENLSPEERARLIAKQNLERGTTMSTSSVPDGSVDTTIHADSIVVQSGSGSSPVNKNKACVQIGSIGNSGACAGK